MIITALAVKRANEKKIKQKQRNLQMARAHMTIIRKEKYE
jgi:hypothetical protein